MNPAISFEQVAFDYGYKPILRDVTFSIREGEFIGLIGPNGGGKTTLLKLIMGFLKPFHGKIRVFGSPPEAAGPLISYVPQSLKVDPSFPISLLEVVLTGRLSKLKWYGLYSREDRNLAMNALEKVGLAERRKQPFTTLSSGQAQRALIARALVSEPSLLLLDEPTANVDIQSERAIYELIDSLRSKMTILMVTHDLKTVIEKVERILCVQGTALFLKPEEVCDHFALGLYHTPLLSKR